MIANGVMKDLSMITNDNMAYVIDLSKLLESENDVVLRSGRKSKEVSS